jgi:hypothetical protein
MADLVDSNKKDSKPIPCWSTHDLIEDTFGGLWGGAVVGTLGDGIGALPGAAIGFVAGAASWSAASWSAANALSELDGNCPADSKTLPQVEIDHSNQK